MPWRRVVGSAIKPLMMAAKKGDGVTIELLLLKAGALVNIGGAVTTALHIAVENIQLHIVEAVTAAGAEIDGRDHLERTPLHLAASAGFREEVAERRGSAVRYVRHPVQIDT